MRFKTLFVVLIIGLSVAGWSPKADAKLLTYDMSWSGDSGYSMTGMFSFDDTFLSPSGLVTLGQLFSFEATAFRPNGVALETYAFTFSDLSVFAEKDFFFNFNFEPDTEILRQTGLLPLSPVGLAFGVASPGQPATPNDWILYGGRCTRPFGTGIVLDDTTGVCASRFDTSTTNFVQVSLRGGPLAEVKIPEPGTLAMFGFGIAGLGLAARRKRA